MKTIKDGLVYEHGRVVAYVRGVSQAQLERYISSVRWGPVVERFIFDPQRDVSPDGQVFAGLSIRDLRRDPDGHANLEGPDLKIHDVDLAAFQDDDRIRVTWINLDTPSEAQR